tara:strand:+ start:54 stop:278 length:225 start_codon:yes stop_codon:yes gene_type:complete
MRRYLATNAFNMQYAFITHNKFTSKNHIIKKPFNKKPVSFNKKPLSFNKKPFNKKSYELTEKRLKEMNRDIFLL